jgi:endoglucanase
VAIRYGTSCYGGDRIIAAALWPTLHAAGSPTPYKLTLQGSPLVGDAHPVSVAAAAAAASANGDQAAGTALLQQASALDARFPSYYGAAWTALGRIVLTTDWLPLSCNP